MSKITQNEKSKDASIYKITSADEFIIVVRLFSTPGICATPYNGDRKKAGGV
jgi:hypothetical protein